jgi:hypothetical protein
LFLIMAGGALLRYHDKKIAVRKENLRGRKDRNARRGLDADTVPAADQQSLPHDSEDQSPGEEDLAGED